MNRVLRIIEGRYIGYQDGRRFRDFADDAACAEAWVQAVR